MGGSSPRISRTTLPTVARRDKDRRRGRRRQAAPWAALILVVGVNCALYSLLQSKKDAARLDASLDATVAWRERALAAEETVAALAERLGAPPPPPRSTRFWRASARLLRGGKARRWAFSSKRRSATSTPG